MDLCRMDLSEWTCPNTFRPFITRPAACVLILVHARHDVALSATPDTWGWAFHRLSGQFAGDCSHGSHLRSRNVVQAETEMQICQP
jgi:hypothetical protein